MVHAGRAGEPIGSQTSCPGLLPVARLTHRPGSADDGGGGVTDESRPAPALPPPPPAAPHWSTAGPPGASPPRGPAPSRGWRTTIAVGATILVVVIGVNVADASVPLPENPAPIEQPGLPEASFQAEPGGPDATLTPVDPGPIGRGETIDLGLGYTIRVPDGWSLVSQDQDTTVLQRGAALLILAAVPTEDTPEELATWYRDAWFQDGTYTGGDPESRTVGGGIPAARLDYTGTFEGTSVDGRIVAASEGGAALLVNLIAPTGSLVDAAQDLEAILESVRLGG